LSPHDFSKRLKIWNFGKMKKFRLDEYMWNNKENFEKKYFSASGNFFRLTNNGPLSVKALMHRGLLYGYWFLVGNLIHDYWKNYACNMQISNNFMYYFSSSMIFFYGTSYLNFQIFGKKSLNFIISRNIIEDIHYVMHKCTWDTNQINRISVKNRKYYLLLLFGC